MRHELISDCRTNEVRPIGIEPFLHEQIDLPQVDQSEIDGDLLGVRALRFGVDVQPPLLASIYHPSTIQWDGKPRSFWLVLPTAPRQVNRLASASGSPRNAS